MYKFNKLYFWNFVYIIKINYLFKNNKKYVLNHFKTFII